MKRSGAAAYSWEKAEQIQLQHEGTGTPDTTKHEWRVPQCQDSLSTIILLPGLLTYQSMGLSVSEASLRAALLDRMVQPCGPRPDTALEVMTQIVKDKIEKGEVPTHR